VLFRQYLTLLCLFDKNNLIEVGFLRKWWRIFLLVADHPKREKLSTLSLIRAANTARDASSYGWCSFVLN